MIRALVTALVVAPALVLAQSSVGELQRASDKAQVTHDQNVTAEEVVFDAAAVQEQPQFPGGEAALYRYFAKNFRYPEEAFEAGISGKVYVEFVIRETGRVTDATVRRSAAPALDAEALRVVNNMPWWTPGKNGGKAVAVRFLLPVNCVLPK